MKSLFLCLEEKRSLGMAMCGYHWFTRDPVHADGKERSNIAAYHIDADNSMALAWQYGATV